MRQTCFKKLFMKLMKKGSWAKMLVGVAMILMYMCIQVLEPISVEKKQG
jgi:hypothetical protein